jgi:probable rRNA maturation factor
MSTSKIKFFFIDVRFSFNHRTKLKRFIQQIFKKEGKEVISLNYIFCTDKYLLTMNSKYLGHNYYTDILTFDFSNSSSTAAEIYISIDRVKENSKKLKIPFSTEIKRVMFHGVLHLCGYKDSTKLEISLIRKKEDDLLNSWHCFT